MFVKNRYHILQEIGSGTFGNIYLGEDVQKNKNQVAIKYDSTELGFLRHEATMLNYLTQQNTNLQIPHIYWYGKWNTVSGDEKQCIVMSFFNGGTLTKYIQKIDSNTLILWMQKILLIIKEIHELNVIHRDIKPDNIMLHHIVNECGIRSEAENIHAYSEGRRRSPEEYDDVGVLHNTTSNIQLIDFGLSTFYIDGITNKHVPRNTVPSTELTGSPLYVSLNTHQGIKPSRRDDCIQLGYVYLYMSLGGHLPWEGISMVSSSIIHPTNQERAQLKQNYVSQDPLWTSYMQRCMELKYDETPDYIF